MAANDVDEIGSIDSMIGNVRELDPPYAFDADTMIEYEVFKRWPVTDRTPDANDAFD